MTPSLLAQQMSRNAFIQVAQATELVNHGRNWEVFLNGCSLGFADGSREAALAQVHQREVNNALYANSPDAPSWMHAVMPSAEVLAEYPDVLKRFPDVDKMVRCYQEVDPREVLLTHQQFNAYIEQCSEAMDKHLRNHMTLPAGHDWKRRDYDLRWNGNDPLRSTLHGLSFVIGPALANNHDERQLAIEIRYFWQRRTLHEDGRTESFGGDRHRVALWVSQGRPFTGMTKNLLAQPALFFYADEVDVLAIEVAAAIGNALSETNQVKLAVA